MVETCIAIRKGRKVAVQVVTVVTRLILRGFFRHHLIEEVVTRAEVVTGRGQVRSSDPERAAGTYAIAGICEGDAAPKATCAGPSG